MCLICISHLLTLGLVHYRVSTFATIVDHTFLSSVIDSSRPCSLMSLLILSIHLMHLMCLICMKYIIIISLCKISLSYIANTSRTHACTHARSHSRTRTPPPTTVAVRCISVPNHDSVVRRTAFDAGETMAGR